MSVNSLPDLLPANGYMGRSEGDSSIPEAIEVKIKRLEDSFKFLDERVDAQQKIIDGNMLNIIEIQKQHKNLENKFRVVVEKAIELIEMIIKVKV